MNWLVSAKILVSQFAVSRPTYCIPSLEAETVFEPNGRRKCGLHACWHDDARNGSTIRCVRTLLSFIFKKSSFLVLPDILTDIRESTCWHCPTPWIAFQTATLQLPKALLIQANVVLPVTNRIGRPLTPRSMMFAKADQKR
jgi:hypothetical protein